MSKVKHYWPEDWDGPDATSACGIENLPVENLAESIKETTCIKCLRKIIRNGRKAAGQLHIVLDKKQLRNEQGY